MTVNRPRTRSGTAKAVPDIPAYCLYGEPLQAPDERLIHVETIASRSQRHEWNIRPHRHRDLYQVLVVHHGSVTARVDSSNTRLRAPAALVVPPGAVHSFVFEAGTVGIVISFAPGLVADLVAASPGFAEFLATARSSTLLRAVVQQTDLAVLGDMLLREFARSAPGRHHALRGLLGALLANLWRLCAETTRSTNDHLGARQELVARFRKSIEEHLRLHRSVSVYASELGVSESRLRRACLTVTGQTAVAVIQTRMLVEAERLLRYTTMTIAQVAYHLGFEDPAYFSRFFTRHTGLSPRRFRTQDDAMGGAVPYTTALAG